MTRAGAVTGLAIICFCVTAAPRAARAQSASETAQQHFDRGAKLYNLGHFQEAIPEFEKAYDLDPSPIFLFNIAQSHRQLGNKERALFFYRRYLEQAPNAANRDDVERRMKELDAALKQEEAAKQKPPPPGLVDHPGEAAPPPPAAPAEPPPSPAPAEPTAPAPAAEPLHWVTGLALGPAILGMWGKARVDLPTIFTARLEAAYAFQFTIGELRLGIDLGYAQLPFKHGSVPDPSLQGSSGSSGFWSVLATVRYLFHATPALRVGAGLRAGYTWWSGLDTGNPFTVMGVPVSGGAVPMPSVGGGLRLEYTVVAGLFLALAPEVLWSKTTSEGLSQSVSSLTQFEFTAGAGYAF
ncbi:MAG TPA: tetratricopeptide repeat protein [Polyangia bacterium]|nr:tetratricopeptide repeat protein [Polyangia bacterium]